MKEDLLKEHRESTILFTERTIIVPVPNHQLYCPNLISTCKYNAITFLPKNMFIQFQKLANIYFLLVAALQAIPEISNSGGIPNILLPLSLVLTVSAVRDLLEDRKRKKSDSEENSRITQKMVEGRWQRTLWQDIRIGDLIKVMKDEYFPADLIFCAASDMKGVSYIETKNIDGETNLKQKVANKETQLLFGSDFKDSGLDCEIRCEDPNPVIYQFSGIMKIAGKIIPLSLQQFFIRGSSLKNTNWVIGMVVYTGHESKIMLSSAKTRSKTSTIERMMNRQIVTIFLLQVTICSLCALYYVIWFSSNKSDTAQYLNLRASDESNPLAVYVFSFFTWMLNFTNFVPISLLVTLEMVKFSQGIFIMWDLEMYYEPTDTPTKVQSCSLNEELGQINYIFSDKTGTLTCNVMEFRKLSVNGQSYGTNERVSESNKMDNIDFVDPNFYPERYPDFVWHLACCHSIITENTPTGIEYRANSPDELALVSAASYFGVIFIGRDSDQNMEFIQKGSHFQVKLLNTLEFSSERKRMSVVVRLPDGKLKLLCKGADSVIMARTEKNELSSSTSQDLQKFAEEGLRTLVLAEKFLTEEYYIEWNTKFIHALKDIHRKNDLIEALAEEIEQNLTLTGVTAIEDKLQDKVPETIQEIRNAGINLWVLTGDKVETAVSIGYSCNLLNPSMTLLEVLSIHKKDILTEIQNAIVSTAENKALVISGDSLLKATHGDSVKEILKLTELCKVVLACRVSPQQKAQIVGLIRDFKPEVRTLSIGDGANDVNMITAAHVGIGISGLEGQQAARASDYSISQFSYLRRLLFVHGRECYRRNSILICYNFYKNILLVLPMLYYGMFAAFSGQLIYNTWTYQLFNVTYAAMPICIYAVFDRELDYSEFTYQHYDIGRTDSLFSGKIFWKWILEAVVQAFLVCLIPLFGLCYTTGYQNEGYINNLWSAAAVMYGLVVILVNVKILLFSFSFYWFNVGLITASIVFYFISSQIIFSVLPISEFLDNYDMRGTIDMIAANPNTYIIILLVTYLCFFMQPMVNTLKSQCERKRTSVGDEEMQGHAALRVNHDSLMD